MAQNMLEGFKPADWMRPPKENWVRFVKGPLYESI
jgi:hypothetical protein